MAIQFNDFETLRTHVSDDYGPWGEPITVTQEMINDFAELTGDRQWIHVDVERANAGPFGGPIAHGFLSLSLMPSLIQQPVELTGQSAAVNYGSSKLRFLAPVPAGAELQGRTRLADVTEKGSGTLITIGVEIGVVGAEKPSVLYESLILFV